MKTYQCILYEPQEYKLTMREGFRRRDVFLYRILDCKLGLCLRNVQGKVLVSQTEEFTLAAMSLYQGDTILQVDDEAVDSVNKCSQKIIEELKGKGWVSEGRGRSGKCCRPGRNYNI